MIKTEPNRIITEKRLFVTFLGIFVGLVCAYMYLVSATVLHVVMQSEVTQEVKVVNSEISELEHKLILAQHKVSADIATMQGFSPVVNKVFIDRAPDSLVLSVSPRTQ